MRTAHGALDAPHRLAAACTAFAATWLALSVPSHAATLFEIEANDTAGQAEQECQYEGVCLEPPFEHGVGNVWPVGDVDYWQVRPGGRAYVYALLSTADSATSRYGRLALRRADGTALEVDDTDPDDRAAIAHIDWTEPPSSYYFASVSQSGAEATVEPYELYTRVVGASQAECEFGPLDHSNSAEGATPLAFYVGYGWLHEEDVDWFRFPANAGDRLAVVVDEAPEGAAAVTAELAIFDRDAATVLATGDDDPTQSTNAAGPVAAPSTGYYYARLSRTAPLDLSAEYSVAAFPGLLGPGPGAVWPLEPGEFPFGSINPGSDTDVFETSSDAAEGDRFYFLATGARGFGPYRCALLYYERVVYGYDGIPDVRFVSPATLEPNRRFVTIDAAGPVRIETYNRSNWIVPMYRVFHARVRADEDPAVEQEPNDPAPKANRIARTVTRGTVAEGEVDFFTLPIEPGEALAIVAGMDDQGTGSITLEPGSPAPLSEDYRSSVLHATFEGVVSDEIVIRVEFKDDGEPGLRRSGYEIAVLPEPGAAGAVATALLALGCLRRARRQRPRMATDQTHATARRCAIALAVVALVALRIADAAAAPPNALLVVDENNRRVLHVSLASGAVRVLSPPSGATENLLTSPRGIGTGPDGEIFVANFFEGTIVFIDARTGAQFPVEGSLSGPPAIGSLPRDVAVNPREPSPGFFRALGVATEGELHQIVQSSFSTTGSLLADYPSPQTGWLGLFVSAYDPGGDDPIDYFVVTNGVPAILRYTGATDSFAVYDDPGNATLHGLDATPERLVTSVHREACPSFQNYVSIRDLRGSNPPGAYPASCPGPVAYDADRNVTYSVEVGSTPQRVGRVEEGEFLLQPFADLASGTSASDIALYAPEPGRILGAAWALLALAAARRRSEVSRLLTGRRMEIEPSTTRRTGP